MQINVETTDWTSRLSQCYSGAVYDVLRAMGYPDQVLPSQIMPLLPGTLLAGPVFTVSGHLEPGADPHETLLAWTGMLSGAPAGHVVICQPNDSTVSHMGELSSETLKARGVRGYIADGGCRDTAFIRSLGFPVFCRYTTPKDIVGRWLVDSLGEPISIGGVDIRTGDWVIADTDGVVIIPGHLVQEVIEQTETVMQTESQVRKAIMRGEDPQQAYLQYGKF